MNECPVGSFPHKTKTCFFFLFFFWSRGHLIFIFLLLFVRKIEKKNVLDQNCALKSFLKTRGAISNILG